MPVGCDYVTIRFVFAPVSNYSIRIFVFASVSKTTIRTGLETGLATFKCTHTQFFYCAFQSRRLSFIAALSSNTSPPFTQSCAVLNVATRIVFHVWHSFDEITFHGHGGDVKATKKTSAMGQCR